MLKQYSGYVMLIAHNTNFLFKMDSQNNTSSCSNSISKKYIKTYFFYVVNISKNSYNSDRLIKKSSTALMLSETSGFVKLCLYN